MWGNCIVEGVVLMAILSNDDVIRIQRRIASKPSRRRTSIVSRRQVLIYSNVGGKCSGSGMVWSEGCATLSALRLFLRYFSSQTNFLRYDVLDVAHKVGSCGLYRGRIEAETFGRPWELVALLRGSVRC